METSERLKQRSSSGNTGKPHHHSLLSIPLGSSTAPYSRSVVTNPVSSSRSATQKREAGWSSSRNIRFGSAALLLLLLLVLAATVTYQYYFNQMVLMPQSSLDELRDRIRRTEEIAHLSAADWQRRIESVEQEKRTLQQLLQAAVVAENTQHAIATKAAAVETEQQSKLDYLVQYRVRMQAAIQQLSKQALLEKFGPGPHRVQVQVAFDPASNVYYPATTTTTADGLAEKKDDMAVIVLELAPVDLMPHTVYWFLEQVHAGLYNGCSFHRNAGHVIQAGPTANFRTPANSNLQRRFQQAGFDSVLFQEYAQDFPHLPYTLGFAGRPGGPDFYISMKDNTVPHGPGGQDSYADASEADPCFAKVVAGKDVVDRIHQSAVQPGSYKRMQHYVAIVSMSILDEDDNEAHQDEHHHDLPAAVLNAED
jgi:cyclophilin family peptidyl-prolyl cis-trans isomerase